MVDTELTRGIKLAENYIYFYHLDKFIILPYNPDNVDDNTSINWSSETPMGRSAPLQSYQNSGPRVVTAKFDFHRDMMNQININNSMFNKDYVDFLTDNDDVDYVDTIIACIQASVVPSYEAAKKAINPPLVAMRLGEEIYIKGVITNNASINYHLPILRNGKYAYVSTNISITEVTPYDAKTIVNVGGWRGYDAKLRNKIYSDVYLNTRMR